MIDDHQLNELRECCRDEAAFDRAKSLLGLDDKADNIRGFVALSASRQQALSGTIARIRQSVDLHQILQATAADIRQLLKVERAVVVRLDPRKGGRTGEVIVEETRSPVAATAKTITLVGAGGLDEAHLDTLRSGQVLALEDMCHTCFYTSNVGSQAMAPLMGREGIWGILWAVENESRPWSQADVEFMKQMALYLEVAIDRSELLNQAKGQAYQLLKAAKRERALAVTVDKIRASLDIDTIFDTTTHEVRQLLGVDRVAVYYFNPDWSGAFVAESVAEGWSNLIEKQTQIDRLSESISQCDGMGKLIERHRESADTYLQETQAERLKRKETFAVDDIYDAGFSRCYLDVLEQYEARAYAIVPIFLGQNLWGMLAAYQNSGSRHWERREVDLLVQISGHLGVALQQAELLEQTRLQTKRMSQTLRDLRHTQAQLVHSEKMAGLGQLVAGLAHEINNPVNFISGNLLPVNEYARDLLDILAAYRERYPDPDEDMKELLDERDIEFIVEDLPKILDSMKMGVDRIRELVLSLRTFSRLDEADTKTVDIHDGIDSTLLILRHRLKGKGDRPEINVIKNYGDLPLVKCYPAQLNQVFMNIISNAVDALEDRQKKAIAANGNASQIPAPEISISTAICKENKTPNSDRVSIHIVDNGPGIPEQVQNRIFDPFFTTKDPGKGTGLGLSIGYKIVVEKHGGNLECRSQPDKGTEFIIEIPINEPEDNLSQLMS